MWMLMKMEKKNWTQNNTLTVVWNSFQFAGGFDAESMKAFEDLRNRIQTPEVVEEDNKPET